MQPTSVIRSAQDARRFLRSVCVLMLLFQAYISGPERAHTSYLLIIYFWCIFTCSIVSISFDMSRDISRIRDTLPNTTSKQFCTHTWGYASIPPSWLYTAYTAAVVPIVLGIFPTHSIPSRLNQLKSLSKQSNHMSLINLEPSRATASKHWSPHSVRIRVRVRRKGSAHTSP